LGTTFQVTGVAATQYVRTAADAAGAALSAAPTIKATSTARRITA
jgi:hypothetical protein